MFLEPSFPDNQKQFVRGLHEVGATVIGIGERPKDWLDGDVAGWLTHYEQVPSVVDEGRLHEVVRGLQQHLEIDRLEATVEAHVMAAARVREACGIPGTSVRTTFLCRDKPAMKEVLRDAGIRCAAVDRRPLRARRPASSPREVGFPLVLKPAAGAGASGAERVNGPDELEAAIARSGVDHGAEIAVEEFVEGHEGFYDTITIDGEVAMDFATHYYPNVLEAMRTRWISPQFVATNRIDGEPGYDEVEGDGPGGHRAPSASGRRRRTWSGSPGRRVCTSREIGCRPPGVRCWDLYAAGNDIDIYREWAMAVVHGHVASPPSRRFAAGIIALRPDRDGTISRLRRRSTRSSTATASGSSTPTCRRPGTPTQPVEAGYMANAWVRMRHPDYDALREMLDDVGRTVQGPRVIRATDGVDRPSPTRIVSFTAETPSTPAVADGGAVPDRRARRVHVRLPRSGRRGAARPLRRRASRTTCRFEPVDDSELVAAGARPCPTGSRLEYKLEVVDSFGSQPRRGSAEPDRARRNPFGANSVCEAHGLRRRPTGPCTDPDVAAGHARRASSSKRRARPATTDVGLPAGRLPPTAARAIRCSSSTTAATTCATPRRRPCSTTSSTAATIPPIVVAFVHPGERLVEYADDPRHATFLTEELVPALEAELAARRRRRPAGASWARASAPSPRCRPRAAHPRLLRAAAAAVGLVRRCRRRAAGAAAEPLWRPVRRFVDAYLADPVAGRRAGVRELRGVRVADLREPRRSCPCSSGTGMDVRFVEARDGHNWENWRDSLGGLAWLFLACSRRRRLEYVRRPWPTSRRRIGLSLGADLCWPICYEELLRRLDLALAHRRRHRALRRRAGDDRAVRPAPAVQVRRRRRPPDALVHTSREWIKKAVLMDGLYVFNNPWAIQSMEKHTTYCAMMRARHADPRHVDGAAEGLRAASPTSTITLQRYAKLFDLGDDRRGGRLPAVHEAVRRRRLGRRQPGRRRGRAARAPTTRAASYLMHLQTAVEPYDLLRALHRLRAADPTRALRPGRAAARPLHDGRRRRARRRARSTLATRR